MTGWQWFHMFDTSMFFHHMWSWLTHPLHHRPSWPSWHFVNLTGGWLSVTLSTTSWHKVHHRIEEHQRKMNLNPPHLPQRLFFPSCWRNPRPRSPATPTKQWTPWMDALISPTRTFESIFPVEHAIIFGGFHMFSNVGINGICGDKKGFGEMWFEFLVVRGGDDWYQARLRCGSLEVCHHARGSSNWFSIGKDLAATQESLHTTQNSLSDCFNEVRLQTLGHFVGTKWAKCGKGKKCPQIFGSENNFYPKDTKVLKT